METSLSAPGGNRCGSLTQIERQDQAAAGHTDAEREGSGKVSVSEKQMNR